MTLSSALSDMKTADSGAPNREIVVGGIIAFLFFVVFLGWAAFAPLDSGAYASGEIVVSGNRQAVQHREGGTVSALHVKEGDTVKRGQVLVELAGGDLKAVERSYTGQVIALLSQRARLAAERDGRPGILTPAEFNGMSAEDQVLADEAMRLQRQQFGARGAGRGSKRDVLGQQVAQLTEQIGGLQRQLDSNLEQRRLIEQELAGTQSLADRGYAPQTRVLALQRAVASLEGEEGSLRSQMARAREAIGETRLQMLAVNTELNEDVAEQLRQVEVQLNDLQPKQSAVRDQIARSLVRSPADGKVVGLTIFTVGGVVGAGQVLMEIVPDKVALVIDAKVSPMDADNVRAGQEAQVRLSALRERNLPIIHGVVTTISADSLTDEATKRNYFRAQLEVPQSEIAKLGGQGGAIRPGLPVEVVVTLKKRTALQYIFDPLTRALWQSGHEQ